MLPEYPRALRDLGTRSPVTTLKTGMGAISGQLTHCQSAATQRTARLSVELLMK